MGSAVHTTVACAPGHMHSHPSYLPAELQACACQPPTPTRPIPQNLQVKQSRTRGGCPELDAAELRAKEQEAARAAAELLEQLEKEEAAKSAAAKAAAAGSASASKKKKKGGHRRGAYKVRDAWDGPELLLLCSRPHLLQGHYTDPVHCYGQQLGAQEQAAQNWRTQASSRQGQHRVQIAACPRQYLLVIHTLTPGVGLCAAGKGKAGSADADAADVTQDSTADAAAAAHEHALQQQAAASKQQPQQQLAAAGKQQQPRQQQQHAGLSNGHRSGWDPQEPRRSSEDSNGQLHRQQQQQQPGKQEGLQQQHSLGRTSSETSQHHHHHRDVTTPGSGEAQTATCGLN